MNINLDEYAYLRSPIHSWEPRHKLIGILGLIFAFSFVQSLWLVPLMLLVVFTIFWLSRLPWSFLQTRLRYPGLLIAGIVIALPFLAGQTVLWQWGFLSIKQEGIEAMLLVASRFLSIVTLGLILVSTTPFLTTIRALRSLGLPPTLADMLLLSYRYLFEVAGTLATMQQAMRLRGFGQRRSHRYGQTSVQTWFRHHWTGLQRLASLAGTLIIRSYEQSEQVYRAMRLRGYGSSNGRSLPQQPHSQTVLWHRIGLIISILVAMGFVIAQLVVS
jgi:cobalt/nickel transport system permease protein